MFSAVKVVAAAVVGAVRGAAAATAAATYAVAVAAIATPSVAVQQLWGIVGAPPARAFSLSVYSRK